MAYTYAQERLPQFLKHTVKQGEDINSIAQNFNVDPTDMLLLNDFPKGVNLEEGQVILVRLLRDGETPPKEEMASSKPSKTTTKTATANNSPKAAPVATKPVTENKEVLSTEPVASVPAASTKKVETGPNGTTYQVTQAEYHVVEKGQTFYRIALIYGLTIDQLKALNNMSNTNIAVGQKLKVR